MLHWIQSGTLTVDWALRVDALTAVMLVVVTTVSSLVHLYSWGYMEEDPGQPRFFAYLSLFSFAMLMLVTADSLVQMFFGWEGVGLASYLLIGFWYHKPSANAAALKAFVVNRIGDFGFSLGIFGTFLVFGTVSIPAILAAAPGMAGSTIGFAGMRVDTMTLLCLLLFVGAMGKSAQLGLHTWLPDAMEGPTPVSALIHAATMVTAGVFMVCRLSPMFETSATAMHARHLGRRCDLHLRRDRRLRAERHQARDRLLDLLAARLHVLRRGRRRLWRGDVPSVHPRLFQGLAVPWRRLGDPRDAPRAGHALLRRAAEGDPDHLLGDGDRHAGDHRRRPRRPVGFAGFWSKDAILESAWASGSVSGTIAFWLGAFAALLTSFYSWRLIFLTFFGAAALGRVRAYPARSSRSTTMRLTKSMATAPMTRITLRPGRGGYHPHESPLTILVPIALLALGALLAGQIFHSIFVDPDRAPEFWRGSVAFSRELAEAAEGSALWVKLTPTIVMLVGLWIAWNNYIRDPSAAGRFVAMFPAVYKFVANKWYFDELYDFLFVRPALKIGRVLWHGGDEGTIDRFGPHGAAYAVGIGNRVTTRLQSGYLYSYALVMLVGLIGAASWAIWWAK